MKKIFITISLGLVSAILATTNFVSAANLNEAVTTLPQNDEWAIMAYASLGQNVGQNFLSQPINNNVATDYEKRILAITAIGQNPQTISSENFVTKLQSMNNNNQLGDASLLNDDIFGVLALKSAGISDNTVSSSRQFILNHQNLDGGWGYAISVGSDSNTTAMAVSALSITGGAPNSAFDYLSRSQNSSGGFGYTPGTSADGASTAWVIMGLNISGYSVPTGATAFLNSLQTNSGAFKWKLTDNNGDLLVTSYAVIALSGHGIPINTIATTSNPPPPPPPPVIPPPVTPPPPPVVLPPPPPPPTGTISTDNSRCFVPIFHTNFPLPKEGGKIVTIDGHLYFVQTYVNGCANAGSTGATTPPPVNPPPPPPPQNPDLTPSYPCYVPVFTTNFAFPPEGGKIVMINGQMYFIQTYLNGCANAGSTGTAVSTNSNQTNNNTNNNSTSTTNQSVVRVSITYNSSKIFSGPINYVSGMTALSALTAATSQSGIPTDIRHTALGTYVAGIDGYAASGSNGWQYAVNGSVPSTSATNFTIQPGNTVQWFFGAPNSNPY